MLKRYTQSLQQRIDQQRMVTPYDSTNRPRTAFFWVAGICIFQLLLTLSFTIFFLSSKSLAAGLYGQLDWLSNYSPLLVKYRAAATLAKPPFEFAAVFSIYFSFLAAQAIVLPAILTLFFKSLPSRLRFHLSRDNVILLIFALLLLIYPVLDIWVGPSDITNPGLFSNRIFYGSVGTAFVEYCIMLPCTTWFSSR